jgi:hypothetical protein
VLPASSWQVQVELAQLYWFDPGSPTGHYRLQLERPADRLLLRALLDASEKDRLWLCRRERARARMSSRAAGRGGGGGGCGHGSNANGNNAVEAGGGGGGVARGAGGMDASQHGDRSSIRNATMDGLPPPPGRGVESWLRGLVCMQEARVGDDSGGGDGGGAKKFSTVELDYVSPRRPRAGTRAMSARAFAAFVDERIHLSALGKVDATRLDEMFLMFDSDGACFTCGWVC